MPNIYFESAVDASPLGSTSMWRACVLVPHRTVQADQAIWAHASDPETEGGWLLEYLASGSFRWVIADGVGAEQTVSLAVALSTGHPVVVVASFDGSTLRLHTSAASANAAATGYTASSGLTMRVGTTPAWDNPARAFTVGALLASDADSRDATEATALAAELETRLERGQSLAGVTSATPAHVWEASDFVNTTWTDSVGAVALTEVGEVQPFSFPSE